MNKKGSVSIMNKFDDLYKLFVESADKISDKRITQNNIYITLQLAILSFISLKKIDDLYLYIFCIIGIIIAILWFITIDNYSKRNKIKYSLINEYESRNNINWFLEEEKRLMVLTNLTFIEKIIPILFLVVFVIIAFLG